MVTRTICGAMLTLLALTWAPQIGAQENEARALFVRGNQALSAGRRHEALVLFLRSLELTRRPSTLLNIAQCYRLLQFPEQALLYYQRYVESNPDPSAPVKYEAEVNRYIVELRTQTGLLAEARAQQRAGDHAAAIVRLNRLRKLTNWPGVALSLAQSYAALNDTAHAMTFARAALAGYQFHLGRWREAGAGPAPGHVVTGAKLARRLVRRLQPVEPATRPPPLEPERSVPPERPGPPQDAARGAKPRSKAWLITAVVAGALALTAEIVAIVFYRKADRLRTDNPDFDTYRSVVIAGHVSAGVLAALSVTGVVLHLTLAPSAGPDQNAPRGALVTATFRF